MGLATLKERFADPEIKARCTGMFLLDNPKKHALLYQLLYECRTWCAYGRDARTSQGERSIQQFCSLQS